jgi:regulator of PEP synthase PpsR (kinase-PPPase family)
MAKKRVVELPRKKGRKGLKPAAATPAAVPCVLLVSGGTGRTAQQMLAAAIAQFPSQEVKVVSRSGVRNARQVEAIVKEAVRLEAVLMHTLVDPQTRQALDVQVRRKGIPCVDMIGPTLSALGDRLQTVPCGRPGLLYELNREQFDRMDAVDFTLAHDDGLLVQELDRADVVLVGGSRTSKSVTCFYLASRGIRAANVPLIPGCPVPEELTSLRPDRVIGLTMNTAHLASLRRTRLDLASHRKVDGYADAESIQAELRQNRALMSKHGWTCIDVSYQATEEVADQIIELIETRSGR